MKTFGSIPLALGLIGVSAAYGASGHALAGWGPFRFRMTAWQALHVPGAEPSQAGNIAYMTNIGGEAVSVTVVPTSTRDALTRIAIRYERPEATTESACVAARGDIEQQVNTKYGRLSPSNAEGNDVLSLPDNTGIRVTQAGVDGYGTPCFVVVTFFHEATPGLSKNVL